MSDFDDVGDFHERFGLESVTHLKAPHLLDVDTMRYRIGFLGEELNELRQAALRGKLAEIADALVDIVYVALGTAQLMSLPWPELFAEVQRANMTKKRCGIDHFFSPNCCDAPEVDHSKRGSALDVIKPTGWTAPNLEAIIDKRTRYLEEANTRLS